MRRKPKGSRVLARSTLIFPEQNGEKKPRKLPCQPPPQNLTMSRRIPARPSSSRIPFLSGRPSGIRQTKGAASSPLTSPTVLILVPWSQGFSALYGVHASAVKTSVRGLLPQPIIRSPSTRSSLGWKPKVSKPLRSQTGPRTLLREREGVQYEGWYNLEGCKTPSCVFATQIHRLRDITDLLQILANKEYARLTGDSPVEAKVADAENDGNPGSREPFSVTQIFAEAGRQDLRRVRFILHFYRLTCCKLDPLVGGLFPRNSWNSPARNRGLVTTMSSRNLSVLRTHLYAFPFPGGRHCLTLSP